MNSSPQLFIEFHRKSNIWGQSNIFSGSHAPASSGNYFKNRIFHRLRHSQKSYFLLRYFVSKNRIFHDGSISAPEWYGDFRSPALAKNIVHKNIDNYLHVNTTCIGCTINV
ncbi:hypothetical protein THIOM_005389 [Candidatus Thiomargarita nelsonii]|uniref:Uncharacterized protein n=1 Tax=Candidatus Thiomargarita nelsonii TaxID=1003181 RepID=A0A176RTD6_9GAMM|nr:hypothetical protein THIOM_005389 [Candidatus Thiomargarita nelsonii]